MYVSEAAKLTLRDGATSFTVTALEPAEPVRAVLFAVGAGGNPERHLPLLSALADCGCTVVAPHFDRLIGPIPNDMDLRRRARRLKLALDYVARPGLPAAGVGHSIGATMLLTLVGAEIWMPQGHRLSVVSDPRLTKLALLTPATGFFQAPGALDGVQTPIVAWAGTKDVITPPLQTEFLKRALARNVSIDVRIVEDAGHFSFMNEPPPHTVDTLRDRDAFLSGLADDVCQFVLS
jgi:pimeloyl-ACP methyl ester carboxylesterase